jgi:glycosyltransferase involved in cell wall biosynthesis
MITYALSTFNTLNYLKLAVQSARENGYYKDALFVIHAENCTDGTDEWLEENKEQYNLEIYIEKNETPRGIGGGMNFCASKVKTKYIGFLSSDFYMAKNWDKELVDICENNPQDKIWSFSYRIEPDIFNDPNSRPGVVKVPVDVFGEFHHNFNGEFFTEWSNEFAASNDIMFDVPQGVSGVIKKEDWDYIGGNDDRFAPMYWEDADIFIRMLNEGFKFKLTSKSVLYHFASRTSRFPDDNLNQRPAHLAAYEQRSLQRFIEKYGKLPSHGPLGQYLPMPIADGSPNRINQNN